jgi:hypothetical protein
MDTYTQGVEGVVERPYLNSSTVPLSQIAVLQYCTDDTPDIDALHRLMKPRPTTFERHGARATPLLIPSRVFARYNAQATIRTKPALFALLLPITVPGRVSDIWRGYFAQRLFHDLDLRLAFLPPRIRQDRNEHSYIADLRAELALNFQVEQLLGFLDDWFTEEEDDEDDNEDDNEDDEYHNNNAYSTVPQKMEALWIALYERGYIGENDVLLVQLWLQALIECNYQFPSFETPRIHNVAIIGQFNFPNFVNDTSFWKMKWRKDFRHVQVRGYWNEMQAKELRLAGVEAYSNQVLFGEPGFSSPYQNLGRALQQYKNVSGVDGVLYIHDDALLNISTFYGLNLPNSSNNNIKKKKFPVDYIIANVDLRYPHAYHDPYRFTLESYSKVGYRVTMNSIFQFFDGFETSDVRNASNHGPAYVRKRDSMLALKRVIFDPASERFREDNGTSLVFPSQAQADFLFVPTKYADDCYEAAEILFKHKVFLECAVPTIVQMIHHVSGEKPAFVRLCTTWGARRGSPGMTDICFRNEGPISFGIIHSLKIGKVGRDIWNAFYDAVPHYKVEDYLHWQ